MRTKWMLLTRREQRTLISLLVVLAGLILVRHSLPQPTYHIDIPPAMPSGEDESIKKSSVAAPVTIPETLPSLRPFDPNKVSRSALLAMGVSPRLATGLVNFRKSGARYYSLSDLSRIYAMDSITLGQWEPFLQFPQRPKPKPEIAETPKFNRLNLEINRADSAQLEALPGIGGKLAGRIIKYRSMLGGFTSLDQLKEVYGMKDEFLNPAVEHLKCDSTAIELVSINELDAHQLRKHPYITGKMAAIWVRYREQHAGIKHADDLKNAWPLSDSLIEKVIPYIKFESDESGAETGN